VNSSTQSEIRMLREFVHMHLQGKTCFFCGLPLIEASETYGHRNHPPIKVALTVHHADENHGNNDARNRKDAHQHCHKSFHAKRILHGKSVRVAMREVRAEVAGAQ